MRLYSILRQMAKRQNERQKRDDMKERTQMALFTDEEEKRISAAIAAAEQKTSGEIVAVVTAASESYFYVPFMWAAILALLVPWPLIYLTWWPMHVVYFVQLATFLILVLLLMPRGVRVGLVPRSIKHAHAHRRAVEQFLSQSLHTTAGRTGVLIFVSVAERYAEVLADSGINAKVPTGTWQAIVDHLTGDIADGRAADGFVHAIEDAGALLAQHFPPGSVDPNELPDHLIVLEEGRWL
jgi:putative membrane protein